MFQLYTNNDPTYWAELFWCYECRGEWYHECESNSPHHFEAVCTVCETVTNHDSRDRHPY